MTATFEIFGFQPFIMKALKGIQFNVPTPVQEKIIPVVQAGKSVIGQSQTGSGKTHAFLLPLINQIDPDQHQAQVVIATPSRELAYQIYDATKQLTKFSPKPIIVHHYVGGTDKKRQIEQLKRQQPQVVIGTPGRIKDLIEESELDVHFAQHFVVDEADMTLDMGFLGEVDYIASRLPKDVQMLVFSATIPEKLRPFLKKYLQNPVVEEIPVTSVISPNIDNWLLSTKKKSKNQIIYQLLTMGEPYLALVFANTKERVAEITDYLQERHLKVAMIHGGMAPRERKRVMRQVHNLDFQFVVATDLAARGIDIEGVSVVINDDIPTDLEFFIHRVGRTGRNQLKGTAITLYEPDNDEQVSQLEKMGIAFKPKELKNGEIVDTYQRNRREHRKQKQAQLDPTLKGFVKKTKKKVKPGYKKKIRGAISEKERQDRKLAIRHEIRQARKAKKNSNR